jgi:hypothetical protein
VAGLGTMREWMGLTLVKNSGKRKLTLEISSIESFDISHYIFQGPLSNSESNSESNSFPPKKIFSHIQLNIGVNL